MKKAVYLFPLFFQSAYTLSQGKINPGEDVRHILKNGDHISFFPEHSQFKLKINSTIETMTT